ncbi:MAG: hypothetical protein MJK15_17960 [Colwellia sp.]|nr:hypothetical protein [Colwellia sp.]
MYVIRETDDFTFLVLREGIKITLTHSKEQAREAIEMLKSGESMIVIMEFIIKDTRTSSLGLIDKEKDAGKQRVLNIQRVYEHKLNKEIKLKNMSLERQKKNYENVVRLTKENKYLSTKLAQTEDTLTLASKSLNIRAKQPSPVARKRSPVEEVMFEHDINHQEASEVLAYVDIFNDNNYKEHWQVNEYINNRNMWDRFFNIRSMNTHENQYTVQGIKPAFYRIVCNVLNINGDGGSRLISSESY